MTGGANLPSSVWADLTSAVTYIREQFAVNKIRLVKNEGITRALDEAESIGLGQATGAFDVTKPLLTSLTEIHVVLALARDLRLCNSHGLPVGPHLRRMTAGSTDFGVPSASNGRQFFFKDFETELFVAATLVQAGLPIRFLELDNDPRDEMEVEGLLIEVKHPDSPNSTSRHLTKFSNALRHSGEFGFFIRSIEDAFELAAGVMLPPDTAKHTREEYKAVEMEANGREALNYVAHFSNILGFATLASHLDIVGDASRFVRKGTAIVIDKAAEQHGRLGLAMRIAQALDNAPTLYSAIALQETVQRT